jgi:intracellular sulfur oxidation DsrE/DsrF family protein
MNKPVSHEYMNAYVDGELTAGEREAVLMQLDTDPEFKSSICELRTLKELVRGAYADLPAPKASMISRCAPVWRQALAAGLLLSFGLAGGWFAHGNMPVAQQLHVAGLPSGYTPLSLVSKVDTNKVVLHLDSSDPGHFRKVLELADDLLRGRGDKARVEVVVSSYGLNLLREDTTPYRAAIQRLTRDHSNLTFLACAQSMARLRQEGVKVVLVPEAGTTTSAIGEILSRMQQGWVYVKV